MTIRQTLFIGFFVIIGIFFLNFLISEKLSSEVDTNSSYLNHSEEVIRNSNILHKSMISMQNGFRGYLLTGQVIFLAPYTEGLQTVPVLMANQVKLTPSIGQQKRLAVIHALHDDWIEYANSLIKSRMDTTAGAAKRYDDLFERKLKMEVGKKINDEIKLVFGEFDRHEYNLRQKRRIMLSASIVRTRNISIFLTIFSITVAIFSCFFIIRIIINRINKMVLLASNIAQGQFKQIEDKRNDEFTKLSASLNVMSGILNSNFNELTSKNQELDQFAYVVSHDLKAPLRGIDNITKWIEEDHKHELSGEVGEKIELIKGRVKRLENMINGLLAYARIGKIKKDVTAVNVDLLLKELVEILVPGTFAVAIAPGMPVMIAEKLQLEQVFSNLISNAVKYNNKEAGKIGISVRTVEGFYEFTVYDNGPGIPAEYHNKIFVIFQTLKERDAFESTGVGLAIVKKIIDDHKGKITVATNSDGGAAFIFTWPKITLER